MDLAELLDLAPIGAIVRDFGTDTVLYWSRGAEEMYGWTASEAIGQITHTLLRTRFPVSPQAAANDLRTVGHWSGELIHTRKDGREIVVASRQAVRSDEQGSPTVTLELNVDITSTKQLEATLRESEDRFRLLVANVQDYAIFMLSTDGIVLTWNEGAQRLKGYAPDEIIGQSFERFYTPESVAEGLPKRLLAQAEEEGRVEVEGWRVRKDGSRFWADAVITALRDSSGTLRGFAKITRDLTERRQAEEDRARASREEGARAAAEAAQAEIRESRDQLATILAGVGDGITAIDTSGRIVFANAEAARLSGFSSVEEFVAAAPEEIVSRFELFDEDGAPFPRSRIPTRLALEGKTAPEVLLRFRARGSGVEHWSLVNATPILDEDGKILMAVSIFRDMTERQRALDMTRFLGSMNLELSRSLDFDIIPQTIADLAVPTLADWCVVDIFYPGEGEPTRAAVVHGSGTPTNTSALPEATALFANRKSFSIPIVSDADLAQLSRDPDHLEAMKALGLRSIISVPMIARARMVGGITLATAESNRHYGPAELTVAEELAIRAGLALDNARLYRESQQQTETHVQLNIALRNAMTQLEQALATRDEFLASASHDLKNPIASIKAMAQLLERRLDRTGVVSNEQLRQTLERIDAVASRASAQVEELLDLTRMRLDRPLDLDREPLDIVQLTREVVAEHQQATDQRVISFDSTEPSLVGRWDARRLTRTLLNILDNASKYSPADSPIHVQLRREAPNGEWVALSIQDFGIGIPNEDLQQIFERFRRGSNVIGKVSGTGIGLASAEHIARSHGGTIEATSELGVGTTITLRLPLEPPGL
jgi:PAS domain S-box-containing protein